MDSEANKRELIVQAAYEVFKKYGYEKTSMNDIANEANMKKGSVYYYFDSKEDIFIAAIGLEVDRGMVNIADELNKIEDPVQRLQEVMIKPIDSVSKSPILLQIWNDNNYFMKKLKKYKNEKKCHLRKLIFNTVKYAQESNVLTDDFDADEFVDFIVKWFYLGDEEVSFKLTKEIINNLIDDMKLMTKYILYGILKRS